jgi:hypothetical protein
VSAGNSLQASSLALASIRIASARPSASTIASFRLESASINSVSALAWASLIRIYVCSSNALNCTFDVAICSVADSY